jgi:hypothetical protein
LSKIARFVGEAFFGAAFLRMHTFRSNTQRLILTAIWGLVCDCGHDASGQVHCGAAENAVHARGIGMGSFDSVG